MGLFAILEKLGFGGAQAAPAPDATAIAPANAAPASQAISVVDVVGQLEQKAAANPKKLNWKTSMVDLMKLLDMDSGLGARKELATELGCPADKMGDSAQMNMRGCTRPCWPAWRKTAATCRPICWTDQPEAGPAASQARPAGVETHHADHGHPRPGGRAGIHGPQLGITETQAASGAQALLPAVMGGFQKQAQGAGGLDGLLAEIRRPGPPGDAAGLEPADAARGDDVLGQIFGSKGP